MDTGRLVILVAIGVGVIGYGLFTVSLVFFSLMAESGGKNPNPLLALAAVWALGELVWTWIWASRHPEVIAASPRRMWGDGLLIVSLIASPILALTINLGAWEWSVIVPVVITILGARGTRILWSMTADQGAL